MCLTYDPLSSVRETGSHLDMAPDCIDAKTDLRLIREIPV